MRFGLGSAEVLVNSARALVAGVLCGLMVGQPVVAAGAVSKPVAVSTQQIQGEQRVLHALNRFTFGPRPGDIAAVQAMGLKRWFEQQLNPSSIDDSALESRLEMFPAMRMSPAEMIRRYPSPQVLRQMIAKDMPLPSDPVEHAIYADEIAFYKAAKAKQEAKQAADAKGDTEMMSPAMAKDGEGKDKAALPGDGVDPAIPAMATHEEQFYSGLEAVKIINLPPDERMRRILAMPPAELIAFRRSLSQAELAEAAEGLTPMQRETLAALQGSPRMIGAELLQSRMLRDVYSERQLEAVMTDFWLNHFNVYIKKNQNEAYMLPAYEREAIRPHALGKFEDLLVATAKSPAMLMYLDNWQSIGPDSLAARNAPKVAALAKNPQVKQALKDRGLNENYARELMELHTLGVQCEVSADRPVSMLDPACGRGYTQQDVTQVAKVLTGWTIDRPFCGGSFDFEERRHEPGDKTVMGVRIQGTSYSEAPRMIGFGGRRFAPSGGGMNGCGVETFHGDQAGTREGMQVLHMLATSPATAKFISTKLAVRFVSDTPPPALVDRMAKAFEASNGDIKTVLRTMFESPEYWSPDVYRAKMKTPEEFVVSAVRASGADVKNAIPLAQSLEKLGMPLYGMQTPNGYSWMAETWVNTGDLVSRMNFALGLSSDRIPGVQTDWTRLLGQTATGMEQAALTQGDAAAAKESKLETLLLGQAVSERTRSTVLKQFQNQGMQQQAEKDFSIRANDFEPMAQVLNPATLRQQNRPPLDREAAMMAGLLIGSPEFQRR
jgi:uncharacterized protein (DUF1800 family)